MPQPNSQILKPVDITTVSGQQAAGAVPSAATRNACKLCSPLGAAMVFKGIRGCLPFLHGSQGCATYIRRYMISHFREPVDIASSSFSEDDAIFGGARNFAQGVDNVIRQYQPEVVGVATTCLSETIGDHMIGMIKAYQQRTEGSGPPLVHVSTPAYTGTHSDGYHAAVKAVVQQFAKPMGLTMSRMVNLLPPMMSCADLRHLRQLCSAYGLEATLLPDYAATLEGEGWDAYHRISPGGTSLDDLAEMGAACATLQLSPSLVHAKDTAGTWMEAKLGVPCQRLGWPLGIRMTDQFCEALGRISAGPMPASLKSERGRLVDAYVDAHKYVAGKRAVVFGEPDLVVAVATFLAEIGIRPVLCATGAKVKGWRELLGQQIEGGLADVDTLSGADHAKVSARARSLQPDLLVGASKGYPLARELKVPLVRIGFPIHDRIGAQRMLSVGYQGTQQLFDRVVNALLEAKQDNSSTGYSYL
jgi:nitrogenase molybdenum-iron protein NifN